ncbi:hypothetical protein VBM87_00325 [Mycoplasma sp. 744]|uniref:HinT-interacting membrane complex lipoprotein P60 n=1 Tax=Mycoplasma sp. 744 TaxID=3108531 RepID=UPI002B1CFB3F|nr:hypothetical protein [Mycoplasma sp. 744]MEA4115234.1 hypothetical protein [Mycoplasma sp. 744]
MKINWKKIFLFSSVFSLPLITFSCIKTVDSVSKIKQDRILSDKITLQKIEQDWLNLTIAHLYNIDLTINDWENELKNNLQKISEELFNDAYKAFQIYSEDKLNNDSNFFIKHNIELIKQTNIFNEKTQKEFNILNQKTVPGEIPNQEIFNIYWANIQSNIRNEISKMLLVYKYLTINNENQISKIDTTFKKDNTLEVSLDAYFLNKYALDKKIAQIWQKNQSQAISDDDFFLQGFGLIANSNDFNNFLKNTEEFNKMLSENSLQKLTNNIYDIELRGYSGFKENITNYNLLWSYEDLSKINLNEGVTYNLSGFYNPVTKKLIPNINAENPYSPYQNETDTANKAIIVYLNQITPIAESEKTTLVKATNNQETEDKILLSFKNTPYAQKMDILSYIFSTIDNSLYTKAQEAFSKLGYKIKLNKNINSTLTENIKEKVFIEVE